MAIAISYPLDSTYYLELAMSDVRSLRPDDYKCWICLETNTDDSTRKEWRRTCRCNLVAHETCLLQWAHELATSADSLKLPVCPQCRKPIVIVQGKSWFLHIRDVIESANSVSIKLFMGAAIGGTAITAIYTTLYTLGATSIRFMCPSDMALDILGIVVKSTGVELHPVSFRKAVLIPIIPIALIASRSSSKMVDVLLCLLPFALADRSNPPWKFSGARLTVSLIPVLRLAYFRLYKLLAQPIIESSARRMRTNATRQNGGIGGINFGIDVVVEEEVAIPDNQDNNPGGNPAVPAEGDNPGVIANIAQAFVNWLIRRVQENNPPAPNLDANDDNNILPGDNENQQIDINNIEDNDNNDLQDNMDPPPMANGRVNLRPIRARPPPPEPEDANWVISRRRLSLTVGNALLLPFLSNFVGIGLSSIPLVQRLVPDHFQRNVLGGLLVIGIKDIVNVATSYLRMKQENSARVLEYNEVERLVSQLKK